MAHSQITRENCYSLFKLGYSLDKISAESSVPLKTVKRWSRQYGWVSAREKFMVQVRKEGDRKALKSIEIAATRLNDLVEDLARDVKDGAEVKSKEGAVHAMLAVEKERLKLLGLYPGKKGPIIISVDSNANISVEMDMILTCYQRAVETDPVIGKDASARRKPILEAFNGLVEDFMR